MATPIHPLIISGSRKSDGTVNAGGRVFLTQVGSANVAVLGYADADKAAALTLNGGGYLLDGAGKAAIYVDQPCTVRIEEPSGAPVDSYSFNPSTNAGLVEVVNAGWNSGERTYLNSALSNLYVSLGGKDGKFRGVYGTADTNLKAEIEQIGLTPQRFGAKGDGVTDDTQALLALAAAQAASGLPIFIPSGSYKISSVITFAANSLVQGTTGSAGTSSAIVASNSTQDGLIFGANCRVIGIAVLTNGGSTGTGIKCGAACYLQGVLVRSLSGGTPHWTTGITATSGTSYAIACTVYGSTAQSTGVWNLLGSNMVNGGGTNGPFTLTAAMVPYSTIVGSGTTAPFSTQSMANGGSVTPVVPAVGQPYYHNRLVGTTAGSGTVAASATVTNTQTVGRVLVLDCFNNSGGAFTFNLNAQYHGSSLALAPASGQRIVASYYYSDTDNTWIMTSVTPSFA